MATSNKNFKVKNGLDVSGTATASSFVKTGGTSAEFLMADGSVSAGSGGGGSLEVSETPPSSPSEGDIWYNSQTGQTFVYYDSFWVENIAGIAGPEGPTGPAGPTGPTGDTGVVISETTPESTDVLWLDSDAVAEVPVPIGGTTGQVLAKSSNDDYDTEWANLPAEVIPIGGTTGQILTKDSEDNYDISWQDLPESSGVVTSATPPENTNSIWFNTETGLTYIYYDSYWTSISGNSGTPIISDTAPTSPVLGMQWFNSSTGKSYLYYSDAWVEIDSNGTSTASTGNVIINGAFDIWQRGTSIANTGATAYGADRWALGSSVVVSSTISRQTAATSSASFGMRWGRNSGQTAATIHRMFQVLETSDSRPFAGKAITLSFSALRGANAPTALTPVIYYGTGTDQTAAQVWAGWTGGTIASSTPVTVGTSVASYSVTTAIPSTATQIAVYFEYTSTGTAGANEWFQLENVQLEAGAVATPFRRNAPSIQAELSACQRYYVRFTAGTSYGLLAPGHTLPGNVARCGFVLPVMPRALVSTTIEWGGPLQFESGAGALPPSALTIDAQTRGSQIIGVVATFASGFTANQPGFLMGGNTASGFVGISAEL